MASRNSPLIVAVSGHRDLRNDDRLSIRNAVIAFLNQLKRLLPDTDLHIMAAMAEGADLLVAQIALEHGLRVDAVLPMPLEDYASDFDPEGLEVLNTLLRHPAVRCIELPRPEHTRSRAAPLMATERTAMYSNLAEHLIRCSSVLLALWDGEASVLPGGTADTVLRYLGMRTDPTDREQELAFVDTSIDPDFWSRLVYWIPASRQSDVTPKRERAPCFLSGLGDNVLQQHYAMPGHLHHQLVEFNSYNAEFENLSANGTLGALESLLTTLPVDVPFLDWPMLEHIDVQYGKADALAVHYQKRSDRLFTYFSIMTLIMGSAYLAYERLAATTVLLSIYLVVFMSSLGLYFLIRGKHWFTKHLVFRMLAETARVKFFLAAADADHLVKTDEVISLSGIDQFRGFHWVGHALRGTEGPYSHGANQTDSNSEQVHRVDEAWIESQLSYFAGKVRRFERSSRRIVLFRNTLFALMLIAVLLLIVFARFMHDVDIAGIPLGNALTFFMGLVAVLLGVWELHQNKMATRELLWQYRNQLGHFSRAKAQLTRTTALNRRRQVLAELGRDSLMESYLWTIHRYHREHEPPGKT